MTYCTYAFFSFELKNEIKMVVYCVETQAKSHEYCEACHFV